MQFAEDAIGLYWSLSNSLAWSVSILFLTLIFLVFYVEQISYLFPRVLLILVAMFQCLEKPNTIQIDNTLQLV